MMVSGSTATWLQYPWLIPQVHGKGSDGGGVGTGSDPYVSGSCATEGIVAADRSNWRMPPPSGQLPVGAPEPAAETTVPMRRRVRGRFCYGDHEGGVLLDRAAAAEIEAEEELCALGNDNHKWMRNRDYFSSSGASSAHSSGGSLVNHSKGVRKRRREEEEEVVSLGGEIGGGGDPYIVSDPIDGQSKEGIDTIASAVAPPVASSESVDISSLPGAGAIIPLLPAAASTASRYSLAAGWSERVYPNLVSVEQLRALCQQERARREVETFAGASSSQSLVLSSNSTFGPLTAAASIIPLPGPACASSGGGVRIEEVFDEAEERNCGEHNDRSSAIGLGPLNNEPQEEVVVEPIDVDGQPAADNMVGDFAHRVQSGSEVIPPTAYKMFGVVFPGKSSVLDATRFVQVDQAHWVLDLNSLVGPAYEQIIEICIFLPNGTLLPADAALAVYVKAPGSSWEYRGAVSNARPSAVLPLSWPRPTAPVPHLTAPGVPLSGQIGISVDPLSGLPSMDVGNQKKGEEFARTVAENLFNFMQSCCKSSDKVVASTDVVDRWFIRFQEKLRRDPECILRMAAGV
ncbi:hypothetical protein CBR_g54207 [Chara braunii]|uniref:Uncharacterized protein n=1 Tax=Chara braunii TaxID=69332 RepID=A0A388K781_CHABU|nr:hypothetical protein CBR_g54207 [Chara braunii]|eukprot:GBG65914.1 hypothetical protein CBR_g54207 [Chara braunii]